MTLHFDSGILPQGFCSGGIWAGIKKSQKKDLGLLVSMVPCVASGLFTINRVKAAPLLVCIDHLKKKRIQALIVNSGNANCMTGARGLKDAYATASLTARALGFSEDQVLVSSTGIIGRPLPMKKFMSGIPRVVAQLDESFSPFSRAIMTTDTFVKEVCARVSINGKTVVISGTAKGAGMLAPQLKVATMLAFLATDARMEQAALDDALKQAVDESFNAITVDACMSTNDSVIVMANGMAGHGLIRRGTPEAKIFAGALKKVCVALAQMICKDGEGATKFIAIRVAGARTAAEAKELAFSVANSNLFKCAMFGCDPNWGRIAAALGSIPSSLDAQKLDIVLNGRAVFKKGRPIAVASNSFLKKRDISVDIDIHQGRAQAIVYTTDLSYGYVRINADYN